MRERSEELQDVVSELQMEKTLLYGPTVSHLEHSQDQNTHLESQLAEEQELAKQLSTRLSHSMEENQRYRDALEHNDVALRRKEESSKHALNALNQQIEALQSENEELKKDLVRYELDIMRLRQREERQQTVEDEKVRDKVQSEQLDTVQIMVTCDDPKDDQHDAVNHVDPQWDQRSETADTMASLSVDMEAPGELLGTEGYDKRTRGTRRSIVMSIHDLASIVRRSETVDHDNVCSHCLGAYLNLQPSTRSLLCEEAGDGPDGINDTNHTVTGGGDKGGTSALNELKEENEVLTKKLEQKQKRIDHLTDTIATMQMQKSKKQNCKMFMPWCG